jgi:chromosome segregation ATPase
MNFRARRTASFLWTAVFVLVSCLVAASAAYTGSPAVTFGDTTTSSPQDMIRIESRISQLEQRFYSLEMSMRSLEQQSRQSSMPRESAARDSEVVLLRAEVDALQRRLAEIECGLERVDERTLSPVAKEARRKTVGVDSCRLNADAPLRLPTRP